MLSSKISLGLLFGLLSLSPVFGAIDINFDERKVVPATPALNAVGNEKGLFFNSWAINQVTPLSLLQPHTFPNLIVSGVEQQATNGTAFISPVAPYKSFDLLSFFFAVGANSVEGAAAVPIQGTILVSGYQGTQEVAVATYTVTPPPGAKFPLVLEQLPPTFNKLTKVVFSIGDPAVQIINLDDVTVNLY